MKRRTFLASTALLAIPALNFTRDPTLTPKTILAISKEIYPEPDREDSCSLSDDRLPSALDLLHKELANANILTESQLRSVLIQFKPQIIADEQSLVQLTDFNGPAFTQIGVVLVSKDFYLKASNKGN